MTTADETLGHIGATVELGQRGEREAARAAIAALWDEVAGSDNALHRCAVAHAMADVQDHPDDELTWDLRALDAFAFVTHEQMAVAGMGGTPAGMLPSLHLNLGESYRHIGDLDGARRHHALGEAAVAALPDDGYARMIRGGLDRLGVRLGVPALSVPPDRTDA